jgi:hypothetical protein
MLKLRLKSVIIIVAVLALCTCVDPYVPNLKGYESLLVIDGLITDANTSYTVKLTRTLQNRDDIPSAVSDATVFITDDAGNRISLINSGGGLYKTDSTEFKGMIGRTYILHILTGNGNEYVSDPCLMQSVPDIDSIYYDKDQQLVSNGTQSQEGITIYLDSKEGDNNSYYRWDFEETWKYKVPDPKKYDYINDQNIFPVAQVKEFCWKYRKSDGVLIRSVLSGQPDRIVKEPVFFIASDQSDRLMIEYSILVKQYSISKNEYAFWDNLTKINETGSDIFASQPFSVVSNIHNINNPGEKILGYFQVSAVTQKRIFIPFREIVRLQLPFYNYPCKRIEQGPCFGPGDCFTWDEIYAMFCITSTYDFVEPKYFLGTFNIDKLVFTTRECANCELTGTLKKPDFWIDL